MANLKNHRNEYADQLGAIFDEVPKTVLAAIAVSFCTAGGDFLEHASARVAEEWKILHSQGIVPQPPGKFARAALAQSSDAKS